MLDIPLLTAFVERWHKETSLFHLLFKEMTIIIYDVSSLFHLPMTDRFWTTHVISQSLACLTVARDLGVSKEVVLKEFDFNMGVHLRMSWLWDMYEELVAAYRYEVVSRVYMLHLVACTLFIYKSGVYINARYMWLFSSLDVTS